MRRLSGAQSGRNFGLSAHSPLSTR